MSESEARMEEIRYTLEHEEGNHHYAYEEDVSYLLERISELEEENKHKHEDYAALLADYKKASADAERLEEENQHLRVKNHHAAARARNLVETGDVLREENQRLRATLEKREEHLAEVRRGGEW